MPTKGDSSGDGQATERLRPAPSSPGAGALSRANGPALEGKMFSHYQLGDRIGGGGMGVIYRGTDTRLEREVAVKFLAQRFTGDELPYVERGFHPKPQLVRGQAVAVNRHI